MNKLYGFVSKWSLRWTARMSVEKRKRFITDFLGFDMYLIYDELHKALKR
jgi:hypothetical protein